MKASGSVPLLTQALVAPWHASTQVRPRLNLPQHRRSSPSEGKIQCCFPGRQGAVCALRRAQVAERVARQGRAGGATLEVHRILTFAVCYTLITQVMLYRMLNGDVFVQANACEHLSARLFHRRRSSFRHGRPSPRYACGPTFHWTPRCCLGLRRPQFAGCAMVRQHRDTRAAPPRFCLCTKVLSVH